MVIELQGVSFSVIADVRREGIFVHENGNTQVKVYAHPQTPEHELVAFLEAYLRSAPLRKNKPTPEYDPEITLFGRKYTVVIDPRANTAYIQGQAIRIAKFSLSSIPKIKRILLYQLLTQQIGEWEERLNILLDEVRIRKMYTSPFIVRKDDRTIVYAVSLAYQPISLIAYVVAISVFDYAQLSDAQTEHMLNQYLPDWKHSKRTVAFEYDL